MSVQFKRDSGLIIVDAIIQGPKQNVAVRLALDTGATYTLVNTTALVVAGYDTAASRERVQITTASGVEFAPRVQVSRLRSLEQEKLNFPIVAHTLPPTTTVDGLLGLDFLRSRRLEIDFRSGLLSLA